MVNHGKQGFIHLKEKQKERREKRKTRTHKPESRQGDCGRGGAPPAAREVPSHVALGVEEVRKKDRPRDHEETYCWPVAASAGTEHNGGAVMCQGGEHPKAGATVGRIRQDGGAGEGAAEGSCVEQGLTTQIGILNRILVIT